MAVSIKKKKKAGAVYFNIVLNMLIIVNSDISEKAGHWRSQQYLLLCSRLCTEVPASLSGADCAKHCASELCA